VALSRVRRLEDLCLARPVVEGQLKLAHPTFVRHFGPSEDDEDKEN